MNYRFGIAAVLAFNSALLVLSVDANAGCGVERWNVKTGTDPDAKLVNLKQTDSTTIAKLISLPAQLNPAANVRVKPYELTVYSVDAVLTLIRPEKDSDFHLVLTDSQAKTLVAEIPSPACVDAKSPFFKLIQNARTQFESKFPGLLGGTQVKVPVRVRGIAFFDKLHGQTGAAPNGIELHPVLDIQFLQAAQANSLLLSAPKLNYSQRELNVAEDEDEDED